MKIPSILSIFNRETRVVLYLTGVFVGAHALLHAHDAFYQSKNIYEFPIKSGLLSAACLGFGTRPRIFRRREGP
jgi:hypothetical protein